MKLIDFHTHIFPPEINDHREEFIKKEALFAQLYSNPKARLTGAEELVGNMDDAGIAVSVALNFNWSSHDLCVRTNDYIMDAVSRYPGRLVGFGMALPAAGDASLRELERCVRGGLKGIGEVRPYEKLFEPGVVETVDAMAAMFKEHGLILSTHSSEPVGHRYPGKGKAAPGLLYRLISRCPEIKVVCAHWGGGLPFYEFMPEVSAALQNTYYDSAASSLLYRMDIFEWAASFLPRGKVLFGSDFPLISPQKLAQKVRALNLPSEKEEAFLGGNAEKLLNSNC